MDQNEVLERAFGWIHWQEDEFEIGSGDLHRLANSISSSVEVAAAHSLDRIHKWLWPLLEGRRAGDRLTLGDVLLEVVEDTPQEKWEESRIGVVVKHGGETWKLAWIDDGGKEPTLGAGVSSNAPTSWNGFEPAAYCILPKEGDARYRGGLNATGDDVGRLFELFSILRPLMPPELLRVKDGSMNDWILDAAEEILVLDGGLAGAAATELHAMAERHAADVVFQWARQRYEQTARSLAERQEAFGSCGFRNCDGGRIVALLESSIDGAIILDSQFPHEQTFDRYLTRLALGAEGRVERVDVYSLTEGMTLSEALGLLREGGISPSVCYDYTGGGAAFGRGRDGTLHIAHVATALEATGYLLKEIVPENQDEAFEVLQEDYLQEIVSPDPVW